MSLPDTNFFKKRGVSSYGRQGTIAKIRRFLIRNCEKTLHFDCCNAGLNYTQMNIQNTLNFANSVYTGVNQ